MIVLALDTSTTQGSVAVQAFGEVIFHDSFLAARSHSSALFAALEKARGYAGRFDRIAVGLGPGSYAGIRIGIAAAIGINLILGAELIGIPSAAALDVSDEDFFAIGDARRGSYYFTWLHRRICQDGPRLISEQELRGEIAARALPVYATEPLGSLPSVQVAKPCARILGQMAAEGLSVVQVGNLEPLYLREPHITLPNR